MGSLSINSNYYFYMTQNFKESMVKVTDDKRNPTGYIFKGICLELVNE